MSQLYNNQPLLDQLATAIDREKLHHANLISSGPGEEGWLLGLPLRPVFYVIHKSTAAPVNHVNKRARYNTQTYIFPSLL